MHTIGHRSLTTVLVPVFRALAQGLVLLLRRWSIMDQTTQGSQVKHICFHQGLSDTTDICNQSVQKVETHGFTDDDSEDFGFLFVRGERVI